MTIVTDARRVQPITDTDTAHADAADHDDTVNERAELARLLAQAYVATPLFA